MVGTRTVTILFCDLVASTERRARLGDDAFDDFTGRVMPALRCAIADSSRGVDLDWMSSARLDRASTGWRSTRPVNKEVSARVVIRSFVRREMPTRPARNNWARAYAALRAWRGAVAASRSIAHRPSCRCRLPGSLLAVVSPQPEHLRSNAVRVGACRVRRGVVLARHAVLLGVRTDTRTHATPTIRDAQRLRVAPPPLRPQSPFQTERFELTSVSCRLARGRGAAFIG